MSEMRAPVGVEHGGAALPEETVGDEEGALGARVEAWRDVLVADDQDELVRHALHGQQVKLLRAPAFKHAL